MVELKTPLCNFGEPAPDFSLLGTDGKTWTLEQCRGERGLLVMFICNHCPYVQSIRHKIVRDTNELKALGIHSVAIMSNDADHYPEDSFDNMKRMAEEFAFDFPYCWDKTQSVAKAYGAVCTPDFFGYNQALALQYRGRLDESRMTDIADANRDLFEAMKQVAQTLKGPQQQIASMGCSIKWRA